MSWRVFCARPCPRQRGRRASDARWRRQGAVYAHGERAWSSGGGRFLLLRMRLNPWKPHWLPLSLLPACKLCRHTNPQHTQGSMPPLGWGKHPVTSPHQPSPLTPGPTCHQLLPAERHGASQQVDSSGFPPGCVLFLFGRPAPVWWPYVFSLASQKPP